jgi:FHA domain
MRLNELEMQAANICAVLLGFALWAVSTFAFTAVAADGAEGLALMGERPFAVSYFAQAAGERGPMLERAGEAVGLWLTQGRALIAAGYERAPLFVIILSALLLLPVVALASYFVQKVARRKSERVAMEAIARKAEDPEWSGELALARSIPVRQHEAWLAVGESGTKTVLLAAQVTRIGRHQDNDIRLADSSVHRYHAVIERTSDDEFVITDLSGKDGNGVRINGALLQRAHLVDGDVIELGRTRLKFESVPI